LIYVDDTFKWPIEDTNPSARPVAAKHGGRWCHLWCDPGEEDALHLLASKIGIRRQWFQRRETLSHYDLVPSKRVLAIAYGAVPASLAEWMRKYRTPAAAAEPAIASGSIGRTMP
jgi:hypothetical protein